MAVPISSPLSTTSQTKNRDDFKMDHEHKSIGTPETDPSLMDDSDIPPLKRHYKLLDIQPHHVENGIPVFKPTWDEFKDFYLFQKSINKYGMESGIVKIVPPAEWFANEMPAKYDGKIISKVQFKSPITQEFTNHQNCFSINNIEKKKTFNLLQWKKLSYAQNYLIPPLKGEKDVSYNKATTQDLEAFKNIKGNTHVISDEAFEGFDYNIDTSIYTKERCEHLENQYWKTISFSTPLYGADSLGSLFRDDQKIWNVAQLPNLLDWLPEKLPGVNDAYLYGGLWKASFSWHLEDQDLYSINYLHFGAPKQWYSISQKDHMKFYKLMSEIFDDDYVNCSEFLRHKTFLASPQFLKKHGIEVNKVTHYEKEFIITYPYGYHSGFNYGYNLAESVNFALDEWLDIGLASKRCMCIEDSVGINVEKLIKVLNGDYTETEEESSSSEEEEEVDVEQNAKATLSKKTVKPKAKPKSQQCILCPNAFSRTYTNSRQFELLDVVDCDHFGKGSKYNKFWKCHRICAQLTPELNVLKKADWIAANLPEEAPVPTSIDASPTAVPAPSTDIAAPPEAPTERKESPSSTVEPNDQDVVVGFEDIPKARKNLKCMVCSAKEHPDIQFKGVCFQCSYGKCTRAYHATCSLTAGALLTESDGNVTGLCRYHRPSKMAPEKYEEYYTSLKKSDLIQFKISAEYYAAEVVSNNDSEDSVNALIYNIGSSLNETIEVPYEKILVPSEQSVKISLSELPVNVSRGELQKRLRREEREKARLIAKEERIKAKEERARERAALREARKKDPSLVPVKETPVHDYELSNTASDKYRYRAFSCDWSDVTHKQNSVNYIELIKPKFEGSVDEKESSSLVWYYMPAESNDAVARYKDNVLAETPNDAGYLRFLERKEVEVVRAVKREKRLKRKAEEAAQAELAQSNGAKMLKMQSSTVQPPSMFTFNKQGPFNTIGTNSPRVPLPAFSSNQFYKKYDSSERGKANLPEQSNFTYVSSSSVSNTQS